MERRKKRASHGAVSRARAVARDHDAVAVAILLLESAKLAPVASPSSWTPPTHAPMMSDSMTAYSTAVGPSSSINSRWSNDFMTHLESL
jgi:hypothetical protein